MDKTVSNYYKDIEKTEGDVKKLLEFHVKSIEDLNDLRKTLVNSSIEIIMKIGANEDIPEDDKKLVCNVISKIIKKTDINIKDFKDINKLSNIINDIEKIEKSKALKYSGIGDFFNTNIKAIILTIMLISLLCILVLKVTADSRLFILVLILT
jgi:hypothetical protein